jgi:hypothetical protein
METDLFSLQGVVVEKELPAVDLFSLQGIVIEKAPGSTEVSRLSASVIQKTPAQVELAGLRMMVIQMSDGSITLPLDITPIDGVKKLIQSKASATIPWQLYSLSKPRKVNETGKTQLDLTPGFDAPTRVSHTLTYGRRSIGALATLKLNAANYSSLADVIADLRSRSLLVDASDFDMTKSKLTATTLMLVSNPDSYLFYPGTVTFGSMPTLASEFTNTDLNGFEAVPLLSLAEAFTNTDLNGFTPA